MYCMSPRAKPKDKVCLCCHNSLTIPRKEGSVVNIHVGSLSSQDYFPEIRQIARLKTSPKFPAIQYLNNAVS